MTRRWLDASMTWWFGSTRRMLLAPATLALVMLALVVNAARSPLRTDFVAMLTGARILDTGGCLYCHATQVGTQSMLLQHGGIALDPYLEPPLIAELFRPLLALPHLLGFVILTMLSALLVALALLLVLRSLALPRDARTTLIVALSVLSLPVAWVFALGQTDALVLVAVAAALWLRSAAHRNLAGCALAVALLKPQTVFLVLPLLLLVREWRWLVSTCMAAGVMVMVSLLLVGVDGIRGWIGLTAATGPDLASGLGIPGTVAWVAGSHAGLVAAAAVALVGIALIWRYRAALRAPDVLLSCGILLSLLAAPHVYSYDLALLLVPFLSLARRDLNLALATVVLVNLAELGDTYLIWSGPHLETGALVLLLTAELRTALVATPSRVVADTVVSKRLVHA